MRSAGLRSMARHGGWPYSALLEGLAREPEAPDEQSILTVAAEGQTIEDPPSEVLS